jgi:hypothetical protein
VSLQLGLRLRIGEMNIHQRGILNSRCRTRMRVLQRKLRPRLTGALSAMDDRHRFVCCCRPCAVPSALNSIHATQQTGAIVDISCAATFPTPAKVTGREPVGAIRAGFVKG